MGLTMTDQESEVRRLCANVSQEQRAWLERWMFYAWPESFVANRLMINWKLDGTDVAPDEDFWWSAAAHYYKIITKQEPPGLVLAEPADPPGDSIHFN